MMLTDIELPNDLLQFVSHKTVIDDDPEIHYWFVFDKRKGASLVKKTGATYGVEQDLWELALMHVIGGVCADVMCHPITGDDVIGWLSDDEAIDMLRRMRDLDLDRVSVRRTRDAGKR